MVKNESNLKGIICNLKPLGRQKNIKGTWEELLFLRVQGRANLNESLKDDSCK